MVFAAELDAFSAQWKAVVRSDVDIINTDLDILTSSVAAAEPNSILRNLKQLTRDVRTATSDVEAGPGVNDLAAMAIIYYVQGEMAPKIATAMTGLAKVKKQVARAKKRRAVLRQLEALETAAEKLGDALLFKAPTDRQDEAELVIQEIVGDVQTAIQAYS